MMQGVRKGYRTLFLITLSVTVLLFALDTFGAFNLRHVTLDGVAVKLEDSKALGFAPGSSVFRQPLSAVANVMCRRKDIGAARVAVVSAHGVDIRTNQFNPAYLVYDEDEKCLRGLTAEFAVAPLDVSQVTETAPLFIGLRDIHLFERPTDSRLQVIVDELALLKEQDEEAFANISAIDCSAGDYLTISFRNNNTLLKTTAFGIGESIIRLRALLSRAAEITGEPELVDMRFGGLMIIPRGKQSVPQGKQRSKAQAKKNRHG